MKATQRLRNNFGYTIMELVAAMVVTTAVFAILFGTYVFTDRLYQKNLTYSDMNYTGIGIAKSMEENLLSAKEIVSANGRSITIKKMNKQTATYRWEDGTLYYNNKKLNPLALKVPVFSLEYYNAKGDKFEPVSNGTERNLGIKRIRVDLTLQGRKNHVQYGFEVGRRD